MRRFMMLKSCERAGRVDTYLLHTYTNVCWVHLYIYHYFFFSLSLHDGPIINHVSGSQSQKGLTSLVKNQKMNRSVCSFLFSFFLFTSVPSYHCFLEPELLRGERWFSWSLTWLTERLLPFMVLTRRALSQKWKVRIVYEMCFPLNWQLNWAFLVNWLLN